MRISPILISTAGLALLAACVSPQQACINGASKDLRVLEALIVQTQADIDRGYAIENKTEFVPVTTLCDDGKGGQYECQKIETVEVQKPVAIDLVAETEKLRSMTVRRDQMIASMSATIEQCRVMYPE